MPIQEPRDPVLRRNPTNYSYKHNFAGINYQIVLCLWENKVLYASAGDPASVHDMRAIQAEFVDMVPDGGRVIGDSGFTGKSEREKKIFSTNNNLNSNALRHLKGKAKSRQEQLNTRMKHYLCMKHKFRHGVKKHKKCFIACLVLTQYAIEDTSPVGEPLNTL